MSSNKRKITRRPKGDDKPQGSSGKGKRTSSNALGDGDEIEIDTEQLDTVRVDPAPEELHSRIEANQKVTKSTDTSISDLPADPMKIRKITAEHVDGLVSGGDEGAMKYVLKLKDRDDVCAGVAQKSDYVTVKVAKEQILEEYNAMAQLNDRGIPSVKVFDIIKADDLNLPVFNKGTVNYGKNWPGYIMEYHHGAISSKQTETFVSAMTEQSKADLENIHYLLINQNVSPGDIQFLLTKEKRVLINDAQNINYKYEKLDGDTIKGLLDKYMARRDI